MTDLRFFGLSLVVLIAACSPAGAGSTGGGGSGTTTAGTGGSISATATTAAVGPGANTATNATGATTSVTSATGASVTTGAGGGTMPPIGGASGGSGGPAPVSGTVEQTSGITYRLVVPSSYTPGTKTPLLIVYSGTEGGAQMTMNLMQVGSFTGTAGFIEGVLDGVTYNGNGNAGAMVLDHLRATYDIDNDRTYLLGESAGTTAAEQLGFSLRESYFAAYWANDVVAAASPGTNASSLGFLPWGQVGPGGQFAIAGQIVSGMQAAGYRVPTPAPYAGQGAGTHGDPNQFLAAMQWFPGKTRN